LRKAATAAPLARQNGVVLVERRGRTHQSSAGCADDAKVALHSATGKKAGDGRRLISLVPSNIRFTRERDNALGRVVADIAVAAVNLDVLVQDVVQRFAARHFRDGRLDGVFLERRKRRRAVRRVVRAPVASMRASIGPSMPRRRISSRIPVR